MLRRHRKWKLTVAASVSREERARVTLHHERRSAETSGRHHGVCVGGWVHILWTGCCRQRLSCRLCILEELETLSDSGVGGIELGSASVCVYRIGDLVVAAFVQTAKIEPDLGDVRVDADSARVGVERVPVLVDLEIQDADGAPESWVAAISIDSLLIGLVRLVVLLASHVCASEKVPALSIARF